MHARPRLGDDLEHRWEDLHAVLEEGDFIAVKSVVSHRAAKRAQEFVGVVVHEAHRDDQIFPASPGVHTHSDEHHDEHERKSDAAGDEAQRGEHAHSDVEVT
jgi:hypothetical protein